LRNYIKKIIHASSASLNLTRLIFEILL
jgi:hypothetical protein